VESRQTIALVSEEFSISTQQHRLHLDLVSKNQAAVLKTLFIVNYREKLEAHPVTLKVF
jgi:hypothetical protein